MDPSTCPLGQQHYTSRLGKVAGNCRLEQPHAALALVTGLAVHGDALCNTVWPLVTAKGKKRTAGISVLTICRTAIDV